MKESYINTPKVKSEKLVSAEKLKALLFDEEAAPSTAWFIRHARKGNIPSIKVGKVVRFLPSAVEKHLRGGDNA